MADADLTKNPYDVLGIEKGGPEVTEAAIKKANISRDAGEAFGELRVGNDLSDLCFREKCLHWISRSSQPLDCVHYRQ